MVNKQFISVENINLGGIAESIYQGAAESVASLVGFDIHSIPGKLLVNQKFTKLTGDQIDDLVNAFVPCSDGFTYAFGSTTGKIWKINVAAGTATYLVTVAPSSGTAGIMDAKEYDGFIFYAMSDRLGRVAVGSPTDWNTRLDDWQTFTNKDNTYHPMINHDAVQVLYIGDGNLVAQYDSSDGSFTPNALDIPKPLRISALGRLSSKLLIGTIVNNGINKTQVFPWDTWSVSFDTPSYIDEVGINAFIPAHDIVLVQAGLNGNLYSYDGVSLTPIKQIQCGGVPDFSPTKTAKVYPNAVANYQGNPHFALSNITGNPTMQGVYSFGRRDLNYPRVLNLEVPISTGNFTNIIIGAMAVINNDMLVAWKDMSSGTPVYGIDKRDYTVKYTGAYFESRIMKIARKLQDDYKKFLVEYDLLPANTNITISVSENHEDYKTPTSRLDAKHSYVFIDYDVKTTALQTKVAAIVNGNDAPEISALVIPFVK